MSSVPVGHRAAPSPPPSQWPSSGAVARRIARVRHHSCDARLWSLLLSRSAPRVATTSAGVVHVGGTHWMCRRLHRREQPSQKGKLPARATKLGNHNEVPRAQASFTSAAGTGCAAACIVASSHHKKENCPLGPRNWATTMK